MRSPRSRAAWAFSGSVLLPGRALADAFVQLAHAGQLDVGDEQIPLLGLDAAQGVARAELVHDLKAAERPSDPPHALRRSCLI